MTLRIDETGFGDVKIYQDPEQFCYGVDAVLLADFASGYTRAGSRVMDLGTGTGIVPLILSHKTEAEYIAGIEVQEHVYDIACKNIEVNGLSGRLEFFLGNVADFDSSKINESFDIVTCNPPYFKANCAIINDDSAKTIARHEVAGNLEDFVKMAKKLLKDRGHLFMVHRPDRLVDICEVCRTYRLEPKEIQFISGKPEGIPNILLVHCVKNGNRELKILKPFSVHNEDGSYSNDLLKKY